MSLSGRFSALFLTALGVVLIGFSTAVYVSARVYLHRQVGERLRAALAVLAAAAEIHVNGVEWEPQERVLPLGQESGADRLRWMVFDGRGRRVDHSRNLSGGDLTPAWAPRPGAAELPARLLDRSGRPWQISQRRLRGGVSPESGSKAAARAGPAIPDSSQHLHPSLVLTVAAPLAPVEATLTTLALFLVGLSAGISLVAALLCRRLSQRALAPLARLAASARSLGASDPGWSLEDAGTGDELDDLGHAFNDLLARLHVAFERQRRFSSDASHQLRTPLTVLIGQIEVSLRQARTGEQYRRALSSALTQAIRLSQIVEGLLFLARTEGDPALPSGAPLELNSWVGEFLASRPVTARTAEVVQRLHDGAEIWVQAHPPLLGQLLENLLDNAEKYSHAGTPIVVETCRVGSWAILTVEDTGPGIAVEEVTRVFEPFYRSSRARLVGANGFGLGLAMVQRIAVAFGGSCQVCATYARGCRIEVRLPIDAVDGARASRHLSFAGVKGVAASSGRSSPVSGES
jgi:signal transduction histidine kinase